MTREFVNENDPRVQEILDATASRDVAPDLLPTRKQIAFALALGNDVENLKGKDRFSISENIDDKKLDADQSRLMQIGANARASKESYPNGTRVEALWLNIVWLRGTVIGCNTTRRGHLIHIEIDPDQAPHSPVRPPRRIQVGIKKLRLLDDKGEEEKKND